MTTGKPVRMPVTFPKPVKLPSHLTFNGDPDKYPEWRAKVISLITATWGEASFFGYFTGNENEGYTFRAVTYDDGLWNVVAMKKQIAQIMIMMVEEASKWVSMWVHSFDTEFNCFFLPTHEGPTTGIHGYPNRGYNITRKWNNNKGAPGMNNTVVPVSFITECDKHFIKISLTDYQISIYQMKWEPSEQTIESWKSELTFHMTQAGMTWEFLAGKKTFMTNLLPPNVQRYLLLQGEIDTEEKFWDALKRCERLFGTMTFQTQNDRNIKEQRRPRTNLIATNLCFKCGKEGHFARECPKKNSML
ncbi:1775_t:CDS:1 [Ambispora leptoticha]|uniref:1775_t:CDS:1 n=1 Tax=Ambispora leptoticha TaxID=144679 RepID=A0A9N9F6K7_9GLOM|nr:1775_t:CDS:1 [Ambispora leptoticha]